VSNLYDFLIKRIDSFGGTNILDYMQPCTT